MADAGFELLAALAGRQRPEPVPGVGPRLTAMAPGAWLADREIRSGRRRMPVRMVVLEHAPGRLSLYSPVDLDEPTLEALAGLGRVEHVVMPNRFHTLFVAGALEQFRDATLLVPAADAGAAERLGARVRKVVAPERLGEGLQLYPVRLRTGFDELVAFHDRAELLVVCDLLFNFHQAEGALRWFYVLNGVWRRPAVSRLQRLVLFRNHAALGDFYRWAMSRPFSRISMSHGEPIGADAREVFYRLFARYGTRSPAPAGLR